ncbi:MAG TPA: hypothetical protein PK922_08825 [Syntrophorhabdus sp.]|nr:hypothetical protein [Syntrophorhabdus sp.]
MQEISEIQDYCEQQLPGFPHEPGAPQHPPDTGTEGVEEDIEKFEADISL